MVCAHSHSLQDIQLAARNCYRPNQGNDVLAALLHAKMQSTPDSHKFGRGLTFTDIKSKVACLKAEMATKQARESEDAKFSALLASPGEADVEAGIDPAVFLLYRLSRSGARKGLNFQ